MKHELSDVHEPSIESMDIAQLDLTASQLLTVVNSLAKQRQVTRPTLARWRKDWGFPEAPYTIDHARLFAYYGDLLALGFLIDQAYQMTLTHFEQE